MVWEEHETYVCYPDTQCEHVLTDIFPLNYPNVSELSHTLNCFGLYLFIHKLPSLQLSLATLKKDANSRKRGKDSVWKTPKRPTELSVSNGARAIEI